ncbi:MAG: trypsin-like peptidase domain-containing protein [Actinomycetes bacterium]
MPHDDEPAELPGFGPPPSPDDRLWRHPSEIGQTAPAGVLATPHRSRRTLGVGIASAMVGAAAMLLVVLAIGGFDTERHVAVSQIQVPEPKDPAPSDRAIADRALPAVAHLHVRRANGDTSGTAIVFRDDGHLMTTAEAVDGAEVISVQLADGRTLDATVIGSDRASDISVIKIDAAQLPTAVLGTDDHLQLGEPTIAIEALDGNNAPNISVGLISALRRRVEAGSGTTLHDMIQTNVRLTESGAGAALVDSSGAVIGVVTHRGMGDDASGSSSGNGSGSSTSTAIGSTLVPRFATPIGFAKQVADELILHGRVAHPWLGVRSSDLSEDQFEAVGRHGARVEDVATGSPADEADLRTGDVIVSIDSGHAIESSSDLVVALRGHHPGEPVAITVMRGSDEEVVTATLSENTSLP